jgi:hypothetical protein
MEHSATTLDMASEQGPVESFVLRLAGAGKSKGQAEREVEKSDNVANLT